METLARRKQRHAVPRGRRSLFQGSLRDRSRIPAHRRGGLGGSERPDEARGVAAPGRGLRHAPARQGRHAGQSAGRMEFVAHRLRQRPRGALAQRQEDSRVRGVDRRLVRPQAQRQMGDRSRIRSGPQGRDLSPGPRRPGFVPQHQDQGAAPQGRQGGRALQRQGPHRLGGLRHGEVVCGQGGQPRLRKRSGQAVRLPGHARLL